MTDKMPDLTPVIQKLREKIKRKEAALIQDREHLAWLEKLYVDPTQTSLLEKKK